MVQRNQRQRCIVSISIVYATPEQTALCSGIFLVPGFQPHGLLTKPRPPSAAAGGGLFYFAASSGLMGRRTPGLRHFAARSDKVE